ncbi:MAG: MFS transporter, partial [Candidatus Bathyarchaeia archaeon]
RWNYAIWAIPIIVWGFILLKSHHFEAKMTKDSGTKKIVLRKFSFVFSTEFLVFMAIVALRMMETTGISTFMTTYLVDMRKLSESVASLIFGLGPFIGIVGSLVGGYLGEKMGARKALSLVMAGCILSLAILSMSTQIYMIMLVYLVYAFFGNSLWSPMTAMMTEVTPLTERGMGFSVYFFTEGITASITPALVAAIIGLFDVWYIFPFSITPLIVALFMVQLLSRYQKSLK